MFKGRATREATKAFLEKHEVVPAQRRLFCEVEVSSLALGTYLGPMDEVTDAKVTKACVQALENGCNFFDTAINYRGQRAERAVGEALRRAILSNAVKREEVFVSTKGGFIPFEGAPVGDIKPLFMEQYVARGLAKESDLIAGCHCMEPAYIEEQIERSRKNLGVETIDLYYLHNPETQLEELPGRVFYEKLEAAFRALEKAVADGKVAAYGMATWSGFRDEATSQLAIQLEKCMAAAHAAGGEAHHFQAVQLPLNLAMPEAALLRTQRLGHNVLPAIDAASALGLSVAVSVPLFQARLCHGLPDFILERFPKEYSQAHCALSFASSFPSVDAVMVGMKSPDHVAHNLELLKRAPLSEAQVKHVVQAMLA